MQTSQREVVTERLGRNRLLAGSAASSAVEVVAGLCGVQAQDLPAARQAVRVRSAGLTDEGVEAERVEDRSFVRTWAMRGTLHLVAADDLEWLRSLLAPGSIRSNARRSAELGLDEQTYGRALKVTERELSGREMARAEWKEVLAAHGIDAAGQRAPYLLARASAEGLICEGSMRGREPTYVLVAEWLGGLPQPPALDRKAGLVQLVHRYLAAYGPAAPQDMAAWSGLGIAECRTAFHDAESDLVEVSLGERTLWTAGSHAPKVEAGGLRLLPAFDTFLLGYRDRTLHLSSEHARKVNAGGGIVRPVVLSHGHAQATWQLKRRGKRAAVNVTPFAAGTRFPAAEIESEVADIGRFLDIPVELV
jgi:hypothetical protein